MGNPTFYFFSQQRGKEDKWEMSLAEARPSVLARKPAFTTVLDLSSVPDDKDWGKVRYRGPFYADFDAGDDLELVCDQFKNFLAKLSSELDFDISMCRLYASGSKGFHVEIPQECFLPKVPANGTPWLPYIYRAVAESLFVETIDLNVYTGKRGRQWRTANVVRENGCYKVPLTLEDALSMTPDLYRNVIQTPRVEQPVTPAVVNSSFVMLFERSRDKVTTQMRNKAKRMVKAATVLDPWRKAKKTPPTVEMIMSGLELADRVGFQSISMQLAIYAASVEMPLPEFLDRCRGLIENHVSDGVRYNTPERRKEELSRMWEYMTENSLYDFEVGPLVRLVKAGTDTSDMGVMEIEDKLDREAAQAKTQSAVPREEGSDDDDDDDVVVNLDVHKGLRRGFFMNSEGMFRQNKENVEPVSRATFRNIDAFYDVEAPSNFMGYEFDISVAGRLRRRDMTFAETFTSALNLRKFLGERQISFQGNESDTAAIMDIMAEKADRGGRVYVYPREGFFVINNPTLEKPTPVKCFLTKDTFLSSVPDDSPDYFHLKYKAKQATSPYNIDIHHAPRLEEYMRASVEDMFLFNKPTVVCDMLGWFIAAHFRSVYLKVASQFPMLQAYGEAGSGKSQTVKLLAHMHWYLPENIAVKSAMSFTPFALDAHASSSTSAPLIIDEYKPRELRSVKAKFEKLKDLFKASYIGGDIGERGTVNKGAEGGLGLVKMKATAPVVFMAEAIEMETAIIERSVCVPFTKNNQTPVSSAAFLRLQQDPTVLSAIGRMVVEAGFKINLDSMYKELRVIIQDIELRMPNMEDETRRRMAPRMVFNRAVVLHAMGIFRYVLARVFGDEFDASVQALIDARDDDSDSDSSLLQAHAMSEISKVMSRLALMSRDRDKAHEMLMGKDYVGGDGWVEVKLERAYDKYRIYCASINDAPLFDSLESFMHAVNSYSPVIDRHCPASLIRDEGSTEHIVRLGVRQLLKEGVQTFRMN